MNVKLVNKRNQSLKVSDMCIGEVFEAAGHRGFFMRIDPNADYFTIKERVSNIDVPVWVIALGNSNNRHTFGCIHGDCKVTAVHGRLDVN